jgi:hypothetical protein
VQQADFYLGIIVLVLFALGIYLLLKPKVAGDEDGTTAENSAD